MPVALDRAGAEREIAKARGGFAGIGAEDIAAVDLVWVPCFEFQFAITRLRPRLIGDQEELIRRWALFEAVTGRLLGALDEARAFEPVELDAPVVRQQRSGTQVLAEVRTVLGKHRNAKSDAALKARKTAYNAVGLLGSTREFAVEEEKLVYVPFFVGSLRRKARERLVAIHAGKGHRVEAVEQALHDKVDVLRQALTGSKAAGRPAVPVAEGAVAPADPDGDTGRTCTTCGEPMVVRHRKADGAAFWGCSTFPGCRHTEPI